MLSDFRLAARSLLRSRTFLVGALTTLALGVGATTAVFTVVEAVLLRPLPYPAAGRLVTAWEYDPAQPEGAARQMSSAALPDWRARARSFDGLAAYRYWLFNLTGGGRADALLGAFVSADLLPMLGARAALGRTFLAGEDRVGAARVAVISDALWRRRFGADPRVLGSAVRINGEAHAVVGVMAAGFQFPATLPNGAVLPSRELDVWTALPLDEPGVGRGDRNTWVLGRLRPGVDARTAAVEMGRIAAELRATHPDTPGGARVVGLHDDVVAPLRQGLSLIFGAVAVVLLVACANVASLVLARTTERRREIALRAMLGATRWQIARQLLAECVLLALAGGALGLALWAPGMELLARVAPNNLPRVDGARIDGAALAFTTLASLAAAALFGVIPSLAAARAGAGALREGGRGKTAGKGARRSRGALVAAEMALSLVLLSSTGLLLRSYARLQDVPLGFRPAGVLTAFTLLSEEKYPDVRARAAFAARMTERLAALPGVERAASVNTLPFSGMGGSGTVAVDGRAAPREGWPEVDMRIVTPDYFPTLGVPLVAGRTLDARDGTDAPLVAVVNEALARRLFPDGNAIGRSVRIWSGDRARRIVGVVGDVRGEALELEPAPAVYAPTAQAADASMSFVVRTAADPAALTTAVRQAAAEVDPEQPLMNVRPLAEYVDAAAAARRFGLAIVAAFAGLALALAALGLYSVTAYVVAQRAREIGVRVALGADRRAVVRLVARGALSLTAAGASAGFVASAATSRLIAGQLYGVTAADPLTLGGVALVLAGATLLAGWLPARRAARADPAAALRAD